MKSLFLFRVARAAVVITYYGAFALFFDIKAAILAAYMDLYVFGP